ncbi:hypothetical protein PSYPI_46100, partial [Pseudomonas syringae pv. pisi str. 1704B]
NGEIVGLRQLLAKGSGTRSIGTPVEMIVPYSGVGMQSGKACDAERRTI